MQSQQRQDQDPLPDQPPFPSTYQQKLIKKFDELTNYACTRGTHLLDDPTFQLFDNNNNTSRVLHSTLQQFTVPTAPQNQQAIQRLRNFQLYNFRQAKRAYDKLATPALLRQIIPLQPPSSSSHRRPTRKRKTCFTCQEPFHYKQNCPKYECQHCLQSRPGHLTHQCPEKPIFDQDDNDLYYDYDPDGNLDGER
jgi:hypothetical protein